MTTYLYLAALVLVVIIAGYVAVTVVIPALYLLWQLARRAWKRMRGEK